MKEAFHELAGLQMGASAKAIAAHLIGSGKQDGSYPHDEGDFMRCEALLDKVTGLRDDMHRMAEVNEYWAALVPQWDMIRASKDRTAAIKAIIKPLQADDPSVIDMGNATLTIVGNGSLAASFRKAHEQQRKQEGKPPMKPDPQFDAAADNTYRVTADELRALIERYERLEAEKKDIATQQKEVMAEAKGRGYDTKVLRKVIALRKRDKDDVAEEEAVLEMYKSALGM